MKKHGRNIRLRSKMEGRYTLTCLHTLVSNPTSGIKSSGSRVLWLTRIDQEEVFVVRFFWKEQEGSILFGLPGSRQQKFLVLRFFLCQGVGYRHVKVLEFFDCPDGMVFSCGSKAEIWVTKGLLDKAKENVLDMEIVKDHSSNTLRVSQSRFYNKKLVQTLLEGYSILLLEGSLSGDCYVEKNGKWSCIYAVGSHEYQMVCTILDIASADVGMLDKFDRGLQTDGCAGSLKGNLQHMKALSITEAAYMHLLRLGRRKYG
nr:zinc finger, CCHC-type [Tanacetum cinerariifolium]